MNFSTRELAIVAVFGTLWGIVEISLGSVLKSLNIPMSGMVLSAIGLSLAFIGRIFVPRRGSTLLVGIIAMLLKLFSLGGVVIGPMFGILTEAVVAEIVLSLAGRPRRASFMLAGALGVSWVLLQPFVTGPLLFGRTIFVVWLDLLDLGSRVLGLNANVALWIILAMLLLHMGVGCGAGWLSWDVAHLLRTRLGKPRPGVVQSKIN